MDFGIWLNEIKLRAHKFLLQAMKKIPYLKSRIPQGIIRIRMDLTKHSKNS